MPVLQRELVIWVGKKLYSLLVKMKGSAAILDKGVL